MVEQNVPAMISADDFRDLALDMPGASEGAHMGHPDFRASGRIFATIRPDERSGTLKLGPDEQRELIKTYPEIFSAAAGVWGKQGWTVVQFHTAYDGPARSAMVLAWEGIGRVRSKSRGKTRRPKRTSTPAPASPRRRRRRV